MTLCSFPLVPHEKRYTDKLVNFWLVSFKIMEIILFADLTALTVSTPGFSLSVFLRIINTQDFSLSAFTEAQFLKVPLIGQNKNCDFGLESPHI